MWAASVTDGGGARGRWRPIRCRRGTATIRPHPSPRRGCRRWVIPVAAPNYSGNVIQGKQDPGRGGVHGPKAELLIERASRVGRPQGGGRRARRGVRGQGVGQDRPAGAAPLVGGRRRHRRDVGQRPIPPDPAGAERVRPGPGQVERQGRCREQAGSAAAGPRRGRFLEGGGDEVGRGPQPDCVPHALHDEPGRARSGRRAVGPQQHERRRIGGLEPQFPGNGRQAGGKRLGERDQSGQPPGAERGDAGAQPRFVVRVRRVDGEPVEDRSRLAADHDPVLRRAGRLEAGTIPKDPRHAFAGDAPKVSQGDGCLRIRCHASPPATKRGRKSPSTEADMTVRGVHGTPAERWSASAPVHGFRPPGPVSGALGPVTAATHGRQPLREEGSAEADYPVAAPVSGAKSRPCCAPSWRRRRAR
jgi:hypothetical protein